MTEPILPDTAAMDPGRTRRRPGAALALGTVAAALAALPAVGRVASPEAGALVATLALLGGSALVLGPALCLASFVPASSQGFRAVLLGLAWSAAPLAVLGEVLKLKTNHRPLGAATYAVLALGISVALVLVALRTLRFSEASATRARQLTGMAAIALAVAGLAWVLVRSLSSGELSPHVLDGLRALAAVTLGHVALGSARVEERAARFGLPLWAAAVVAGFVAGRSAETAVKLGAPVLGGPLTWL